MKNLISLILVSAGLTASVSANAMQLSVVAQHPFDVNIEYHIYQNQSGHVSEISSNMKGFQAAHLQEWVTLFDQDIAGVNPQSGLHGEMSRITFGYRNKGGQDVYPASCLNIPLKENNRVILTENGCAAD